MSKEADKETQSLKEGRESSLGKCVGSRKETKFVVGLEDSESVKRGENQSLEKGIATSRVQKICWPESLGRRLSPTGEAESRKNGENHNLEKVVVKSQSPKEVNQLHAANKEIPSLRKRTHLRVIIIIFFTAGTVDCRESS